MAHIEDIFKNLKNQMPEEPQFYQAVSEVSGDIEHVLDEQKKYRDNKVFERLLVPDRVIQFRVNWLDDQQNVQINTGWRVQYNNVLGPYKGGLRFHPDVRLDTFKFLGFEQTLKNALTGLPMGGGKGGSDFNPKGRSESEIMRFCQAFMQELYRHIGADRDVPAGDIGVGNREIGFLFGAYKQLTGRHEAVLTGKNPGFGGSCIRKEATGFGCVYFLMNMLAHQDDEIEGKRCALSGAGNVALYTAKKLVERKAKVVTLSDSQGYVVKNDGFSAEDIERIIDLKENQRGALADFEADEITYHDGKKPWGEDFDIAIPAATQNEVSGADMDKMLAGKMSMICEAANMPLQAPAREKARERGIAIGPAKAANAGGVAVSGLERSQNAMHLSWSASKVDKKLRKIMKQIHKDCVACARDDKRPDYIEGANIAGFKRVAEALSVYGVS
ncbi:NADP-specific glutamate dehydrogenase [Maritalea mediterranea]|uniref:Glutamate dehydrogenase n=1 Tax=Maritalea mediterranea TaxID=2909667 RepID=A0ABS9ECY1_9HYPH|nr:NADP-specific glutamate dehydrogenase [Maritalea mediterranea]MCF4099600.1 NADP-specific glutamate dehydrogenase [Maritalea mediterranea]